MATKVKKIVLAIKAAVDMKKGIRSVQLRLPGAKTSLAFNVPTFDADDSTAETESEGEDGASTAGEMSLEDAMAAFATLMPILEKFGIAVAAPAAPKEPAAPAVATTDDDPAATGAAAGGDQGAPTMDAAEMGRTIRKDMAAANRLASQLSAVVGTFDHAEMSEAEVAAYGVEQLKLTCAKGSELATLAGYFAAYKAPVVARQSVAATFDSADGEESFFEAQLQARHSA